jgi:hypothetical protein
MQSLSTDWKYCEVLDDITELRTFVWTEAACPPPTRTGVFRLVLLASGWRCWSVGPKCSFSPPAPVQRTERIPTEVYEAEAALPRNHRGDRKAYCGCAPPACIGGAM